MIKQLARTVLQDLNIGLLFSFSIIHLVFLPVYIVQNGPVSGSVVWILIWVFIYGCIRFKALDYLLSTMDRHGKKVRRWMNR